MAETFTQLYAAMTKEDKAVLKDLKTEEEKRTGKTVSIREIMEAVTPQQTNGD